MKMKRTLLLILAFLVCLGLAMRGSADEERKSKSVIPVETQGTLVFFEAYGLRCAMYVNEEGMAGGAGALECVKFALPGMASEEFRILSVVETEGGN